MGTRKEYDVLIIGGGPAGISAALWSSDLGLKSILIESSSELGGQLKTIFNPIDNYLGVAATTGAEIQKRFLDSLASAKFAIRLGRTAIRADLFKGVIELDDGSSVVGRAVIIATGVRRRKLNVPGEDEFFGKGILSSGARDAEKVKGKRVVVIGGGDAALENALILSEHADSVTVVHRSNGFRARAAFVEEAGCRQNVTFLTDRTVSRFAGSNPLESVEVAHTALGTEEMIQTDFALIRIGVVPNSELFRSQLEMDNDGYICISSECVTSMENVYAVGDVANRRSLTIATASGNAATAISHIFQIKNRKKTNPKI